MPQEYVVRWSGARIGTGATVLHFASIAGPAGAQQIADAVRAFFFSRAISFPNDISFNYDAEVKELANDGTLLQVYPVTPPVNHAGTGAGAWVNGSGRLVRLTTGSIIGGRRLYGRIFLVPSIDFTDTSGNVLGGTVTADKTALNAMMAAVAASGSVLSVWSRKYGAVAPVTTADTQTRPVTLRTRNDR